MSRTSAQHRRARHGSSEELRGFLEWGIDALPDGLREVFILRDVEGLSLSEVAASLGISDSVVEARLSAARAALGRVLRDDMGASAPEVFRFEAPRCDRLVARVLTRIAGASVH
jgi:RNA polymerase sigma-70 factor (ECF subfamily)